MRIVRTPGRAARGDRAARGRGGVGVRRPDGVLRAATSRPAGTSRCRCSPTPTARCGRWGSGSARSSAGTRRWSRRRRRRWSTTPCAPSCPPPPWPRRRRSTTSARAPWSSSRANDGTLLVPRDQHPAAGRAPGHRVRHRPGPGRRAAADRGGGAAGRPPRREPRGAAIEVRLYAEDPAQGWRPTGGTVRRFAVPGVRAEFDVLDRPGIRLDAGVVDGTAVGTAYDPMLAKVIAWAPTRAEAAARLAAALAGAQVARRDHQPRPARAHACGTPSSWPAAPTPASSTGSASTCSPRRWPARRRSSWPRSPRRWPAPRSGAGTRAVLGELPGGWRNVPSQFAAGGLRGGGRDGRGRLPAHPRRAASSRAATAASGTSSWCPRPRTRSSWRSPGSSTASRSLGTGGPDVDVEGDGWSVALRALPRFPDAGRRPWREGSLRRADARARSTAVHVAVGDDRDRAGSRCSCSRR